MDSTGQENGSIFLGGHGCPRGCGVPEPVASGLILQDSFGDGSTDSGREQCPLVCRTRGWIGVWDGRERDGASVGTQGAEYLGRKSQGSCTEKCHIHGV